MLQILIGYLFLFFNFEINGIDLLPGFIGYIFIFVGLGKLANESIYFQKARPWSIVMTVFEVVALAKLIIQTEVSTLLFSILGFIGAVISIYIMYCIVEGIGDVEKTYCVTMGYEKLMLIWKVISVFRIAALVLTLISSELSIIIGMGIMGVGFVVQIIFIVYIYRARKVYENLPMNPNNFDLPMDKNI